MLPAVFVRSVCACINTPEASFAGADTVQQIIFIATHQLSSVDKRLIDHYSSNDLQRLPSSRLWVLMFQDETQLSAPTPLPFISAPICVWDRKAIFDLFPRLRNTTRLIERQTRAASPARSERYFHLYFFMHTALAVWHRSFGSVFPRLRYFWRIEPDVLVSSPEGWAGMLQRTSSDVADVLVPAIEYEPNTSARVRPTFCFGRTRSHCFRQGSSAYRVLSGGTWPQRLWSLVSVGRFSTRFVLGLMARQWSSGALGFEEVFLPSTCAASPRCELGVLDAEMSRRVRFQPEWDCQTFLDAHQSGSRMPLLWHPIKQRACYASFLEQRDPNATAIQGRTSQRT